MILNPFHPEAHNFKMKIITCYISVSCNFRNKGDRYRHYRYILKANRLCYHMALSHDPHINMAMSIVNSIIQYFSCYNRCIIIKIFFATIFRFMTSNCLTDWNAISKNILFG